MFFGKKKYEFKIFCAKSKFAIFKFFMNRNFDNY